MPSQKRYTVPKFMAMTKRPSRRVLIGIALTVPVLALTACGASQFTERFQDAPVGQRQNLPADIIEMLDGFSNVATVCNNGNRVYVAFHGGGSYASIDVVPKDPTCGR